MGFRVTGMTKQIQPQKEWVKDFGYSTQLLWNYGYKALPPYPSYIFFLQIHTQ